MKLSDLDKLLKESKLDLIAGTCEIQGEYHKVGTNICWCFIGNKGDEVKPSYGNTIESAVLAELGRLGLEAGKNDKT